jgi:sugar phosphate permease
MCFLVSYAVGGIFMGQLADKYNKRKLIFVLYLLVACLVCVIGAMSFKDD